MLDTTKILRLNSNSANTVFSSVKNFGVEKYLEGRFNKTCVLSVMRSSCMGSPYVTDLITDDPITPHHTQDYYTIFIPSQDIRGSLLDSGECVGMYNDRIDPSMSWHTSDYPMFSNIKVNEMLTQEANPSIVVASFGMEVLVNLQRQAYREGFKLRTYSSTEITEESFNKLLEIPCKTMFEHKGNKSVNYELIGDGLFLSLTHSFVTSIPLYTFNFGLCKYDYVEEIDSSIILQPKKVCVKWIDKIDSYGDFQYKIINIEENKIFIDEAYPALEGQTCEEFVKGYLESDSAILLLYGPPGTGKTSILKEILKYTNESALVTYNKDIAGMDSLFSYFYDSEERFLVIEDADTYINSRQHDGNEVMKKLLNITDGITANKHKKVIFTCNLPNLSQVDSALVREGRLYSALNINKLTPDQTVPVLTKLERLDLLENISSNISLADLFALVNGRDPDKTNSVVKPFGFKND